jgi:hypothetical protein
MSTTSKVMYSVRALDKVLKDTSSDMEPIGSISFRFDASSVSY